MNENDVKGESGMRRLYLSEKDKKIAGVCGGIATYFNVDSVAIRVLLIFLAIITAVFPMLLFYLLAWAVMPYRPEDM